MEQEAKSMKKRSLPKGNNPAKLRRKSMAEKQPLRSEGEQLEQILDELQKEHAVKEIAGWDTGFTNLNCALDGIRPGLHLLIGPPAIGKTSFAKQLLDQVAMNNRVPAIFFSFAEKKTELRIKTLARLSGLESKEIRRGSAYLLHWYGVPRLAGNDTAQFPPSWEKLKRSAEEAKSWLNLSYLIECQRDTTLGEIEVQVCEIRDRATAGGVLIVIDDCQRLGDQHQLLEARLPIVVEQLQALATNLRLPLLAVWPHVDSQRETSPQIWAEKVASADVVMVMAKDSERTQKLTEPNQAITLHIVKNRGGERGKLAFDFNPAFSKFLEIEP
jgi:replicative DNA helicase